MTSQKRYKIYLCDLVHNYLGTGTYMFPLNIGYLSAYIKDVFGDHFEIELFKYPEEFIKRFKEEKPALVGFSNYTWNADINNQVSQWLKSQSPRTIVVFGGPNINYSETGYRKFFKEHPGVDFYLLYQGERAFENLLKKILRNDLDDSILKSEPIDGVVFFKNDEVVLGKKLERIKNVDEIPSPYLTGVLDKFFETNLIPIVETNRGCPYRCTYCCQGLSSYNQIEFFGLERVKAELEYIAQKTKNTNILIFADSNFGILERDVEIAKYIAQLMEKYNYPRRVSMNWAKNQPKTFEIAKILKNINLIISLQSLDEQVLKNIKRQNIQIPVFRDILDKVRDEGGMSGTEIILALPGETKKSHIESLKKLFDWNISYIICYNCLILEGSEMSLTREQGNFKCRTGFRLIDNSFGEYEGIKSFEAEEGIRELETMSEQEILYFRPVHWLIQFLWNYRFYYDLLKYFQSLGINPLDYIVKLIDKAENNAPLEIKNIFQQFKKEAKDEWFDSPEALKEHYSKEENFEWLKQGNYGKMNSKYIFKVLMENREKFERYLYNMALNTYSPKWEEFKEILKFLSASIIDFSRDEDEIFEDKVIVFRYDILKWRESGYSRKLEDFYVPEGVKIYFYLPEKQKEALKKLLNQYKHENINVTLRKMSEFMDIRDFFYQAKLLEVKKPLMSALLK